MNVISYRSLVAEDAERICAFGIQEFARTFQHLYTEQDFNGFISADYTPEKYRKWIQSDDFFVYGAYSTNSQGEEDLVAYVLAGPCGLPVPSEVHNPDTLHLAGEIKRLYAHPSTFGTGVAANLMVTATNWLRSGVGQAKRDIYLGVYSENPRAMKFYSKHHFEHVAEYEFIVGDQRDREFIYRNRSI
mmetsp:Transcript_47172/g.82376  ORF Transcript_47172/g.82376 Transcript_47172/m.82376 type:complete len:188 (-) Transcript_47172:17-580(-)